MRSRRRSSLLWVAVAALTLVTLARAQSGISSSITTARAYASPFLQVLAACQATDAQPSSVHSRSHSAGLVQDSGGHPLVAGLLPILFVGLLLPLTALGADWSRSQGRAPSAPARPFLFQLPPPQIL